ncbi:hypothetical protein FMEAI12_1080001 [Parafrankia sp. Ea1.12]|nr:hypothetical protein FMEAI12_1080001 [Parafrankia sp. Ea1.12]
MSNSPHGCGTPFNLLSEVNITQKITLLLTFLKGSQTGLREDEEDVQEKNSAWMLKLMAMTSRMLCLIWAQMSTLCQISLGKPWGSQS